MAQDEASAAPAPAHPAKEWGKTPGPLPARQFLQGPRSRPLELRLALGIFLEFIYGFRNPYLDRFVEFRHFFVRKVMLVKYSYAFIALPGGRGTLDEIFEVSVLIQTGKIKDFPVVLLGVKFWTPLIEFMRQGLVGGRTIEPADVERIIITDSPQEAVELVRERAMKQFGLTEGSAMKRRWYLGE